MDNDKYVSMQITCNVPTAMRGELKLLGGNDKKKYEYLAHVKQNIEDFIKQGCSLYIYSRYPGNGKTSWAIKLLNGKATIYTSTVIDGDLDDNIGPRLANMVLDGSIIVELKNKPQRKPINIYDVIS